MNTPKGIFVLAALAALLPPASGQLRVKLKPETAAAFENLAAEVEKNVEQAVHSPEPSLLLSSHPDLLKLARQGEIVSQKLGPKEKIPNGLSHYWAGALIDPKASLDIYLSVLTDYRHHQDYYADVVESEGRETGPDRFRSKLRVIKKKVLTATLDIDYESELRRMGDSQALLITRSVRIVQVEDPGQPNERTLPVGDDSGFLWRQNAYWWLWQKEDGLYVELVTLSLSRSIPTGLGWVVKPFITGIPKETLYMTLDGTRKAARQLLLRGSPHASNRIISATVWRIARPAIAGAGGRRPSVAPVLSGAVTPGS